MTHRSACTLRVTAIGLLALVALGPATVRAANTCNGFIAVDYITTQAFQAVGDVVRVGVTLGTGGINGGTQATVNRIRFDLDCDRDSPLGLGCADDGSVVSYGGDASISTTCPEAFTTGHAAGDSPNQVVFTPDAPFDIPANTVDFCVIEFDVEMVGFSGDSTPTKIEEVVGFSSSTGDLACDNGLSSSGSQSAAILTCPPCDDQNACTEDVCNRDTGDCDPGTPRVCNEGDPGTDGNFCTPPSCNTTSGNCQDGPARVCNENDPGTDGNFCTPPVCSAATGNCTNGAPRVCNEGDPGTDGSLCTPPICDPSSGNCTNGTSRNCNDNNVCTNDRCDPATGGCVNEDNGTCGGGEGCTPGYWKQRQHFGSWTAPYTPNTLFSAVFENAFPGKTLLQVLGQGGGGLVALGRHTVAALLNAASPGVDSDLTAAQVIARFNAVFPGGNYEKQKNEFAGFNEQSCPLGRNP